MVALDICLDQLLAERVVSCDGCGQRTQREEKRHGSCTGKDWAKHTHRHPLLVCLYCNVFVEDACKIVMSPIDIVTQELCVCV